MYTFLNMAILVAVYFAGMKYADGTLKGFGRMTLCMVIIWAFGYQFKLETYYVPIWAICGLALFTPPMNYIIKKRKTILNDK